jgi:FtsH-binding integral membrane protein
MRQSVYTVIGSWVLCLAAHVFIFRDSLGGINKPHMAALLGAVFAYGVLLNILIRRLSHQRADLLFHLRRLLVTVFLFPLLALAVPPALGPWLILFTILIWFPTLLLYVVADGSATPTDANTDNAR